MPNINQAKRIIKDLAFINWVNGRPGKAITPLISGSQGNGKTEISEQAAREMNAYCFVVECSMMKDGEIVGLPLPWHDAASGQDKFKFVPYRTTQSIMDLQKLYYIRACGKGFLNGRVRIIDKDIVEKDKEGKETVVAKAGSTVAYAKDGKTILQIIPPKSEADKVVLGEVNQYQFGEELLPEIRSELLESGEIKPAIVFFDEINRCQPETMKELMNIILNRVVNGYMFPWWTANCAAENPSSQNSSFSVNQMDPAQLDRFLKIKANPDFDLWCTWAIDHVNPDYLQAVIAAQDSNVKSDSTSVFCVKDAGLEDTEEMQPSPRSHEMCSIIVDSYDLIMASGMFSEDDKSHLTKDTEAMIIGKIGSTAGNIIIKNMENKDAHLKAAQVLTGDSKKIDKNVMFKISQLKHMSQIILSRNIIVYVSDHFEEWADKKVTDPKKFDNIMAPDGQFIEFTKTLDRAGQIDFYRYLRGKKTQSGRDLISSLNNKCHLASVIVDGVQSSCESIDKM